MHVARSLTLAGALLAAAAARKHHDTTFDPRTHGNGLVAQAYRELQPESEPCVGPDCLSAEITTDLELVRFVKENKYVVVDFYAPLAVCVGGANNPHAPDYCAFTNNVRKTMNKVAHTHVKRFDGRSIVTLGQVNCAAHKQLCKDAGIKQFPTLALFAEGKYQGRYQGPLTAKGLQTYVDSVAEIEISITQNAINHHNHNHKSHKTQHANPVPVSDPETPNSIEEPETVLIETANTVTSAETNVIATESIYGKNATENVTPADAPIEPQIDEPVQVSDITGNPENSVDEPSQFSDITENREIPVENTGKQGDEWEVVGLEEDLPPYEGDSLADGEDVGEEENVSWTDIMSQTVSFAQGYLHPSIVEICLVGALILILIGTVLHALIGSKSRTRTHEYVAVPVMSSSVGKGSKGSTNEEEGLEGAESEILEESMLVDLAAQQRRMSAVRRASMLSPPPYALLYDPTTKSPIMELPNVEVEKAVRPLPEKKGASEGRDA